MRTRFSLLSVALLLAVVMAVAAFGEDLPGQITSDQVWDAEHSPYHLVENTTITSGTTVTVEPGVYIFADAYYELRVEGELLVDGLDEEKVRFFPAELGTSGNWRGIFVTETGRMQATHAVIRDARTNITNAGGDVRLHNCFIESAENDGIFVFGPAWIGLVRCNVRYNGRRGLYIETTEPEGTVWQTRFIANGEYPVYTKATCAEILKRGNRYHFNGEQYIGVSCSAADDIQDTDGWYAQPGAQYNLEAGTGSSELSISGVLLVGKGVTVRASSITVSGRLDTLGTPEHPVTMLPPNTNPDPGDWEGIVLENGSVANLNGLHCRFAKTGVYADGALLTVRDSWMLENEYDGMRILGTTWVDIGNTRFDSNGRDGLCIEGWLFESPGITDCRFIRNGRYPVACFAGAARLFGAGNTFTENATQRIMLRCHQNPDIAQGTHEWRDHGVPYDLRGWEDAITLDIGPQATLNIAAGVDVVGGAIRCMGQLNTSGRADNPVTFDAPGSPPQPGGWEGLTYEHPGGGTLQQARIRHASVGVTCISANPRLESCEITDSEYDGVQVAGTGKPVLTGCTITDNGRYGVIATDTASPNLGNTSNAAGDDDGLNTIHDNGGYEVYNDTSADLYAHNNAWGTTDVDAIRADQWDGHDASGLGEILLGDVRSGAATADAAALVISSAIARTTPNGSYQIVCTVSGRCTVEAQISNIAGRPIARIGSKSVQQGRAELTWNGRSAEGAFVPSGRYFVHLRAMASDGQCATRILPLQVNRR